MALLRFGAETSIEEYIIGPDNEIMDDDQDLSGETDISWIARPVTRQSTVGLVSRHGSMASRSGLVDPLVTLFGSVHEKLPETGSMLFPHFSSMFSVGGGNQPRQEEWDEESLAIG
nr:monosaccharide-sensing protein 2 [Quercus suber]